MKSKVCFVVGVVLLIGWVVAFIFDPTMPISRNPKLPAAPIGWIIIGTIVCLGVAGLALWFAFYRGTNEQKVK